MKKYAFFVAVAALLGFSSTHVQGAQTIEASNRTKRPLGAYLGLLGDPYPTLAGVNFAWNTTDFMRVTAGLGKVSASIGSASASATTLGTGVRFMVPGWNLTPVGGLSMAYVSVKSSGLGSITVGNFENSGAHIYANIGFDWQAGNGFNVAAGYNFSFRSGVGGSPYINLGWFFDLFA